MTQFPAHCALCARVALATCYSDLRHLLHVELGLPAEHDLVQLLLLQRVERARFRYQPATAGVQRGGFMAIASGVAGAGRGTADL